MPGCRGSRVREYSSFDGPAIAGWTLNARAVLGIGPVAVVADQALVLLLWLESLIADDGAMGVEKLVGDVGEDGSATRGDGALGDELEEAGEKLVDVDAGVELGELREEFGGEVGGIIGHLLEADANGGTLFEVVQAKTKMGMGGGVAAALAVGEAVGAATLLRWAGQGRVAF